MFYKFVGGDDHRLADILEKVLAGSLRFASALQFNDPFEFKFSSVAPSRAAFDAWHGEFDPDRSPRELENAWNAFSGPAAHWNTCYAPRGDVLGQMFVLCLTERWDSHLMWAHYASAHRGFAVEYAPELIDALASHPDYEANGAIRYRAEPPELHWFQGPPSEMVGPILFSKAEEWSYEREYRVVMSGTPSDAVTVTIDPQLIKGVILGPRAPASLRDLALSAQSRRPDLRVREISSGMGYAMQLLDVEKNVRRVTHIL